GERIVEVEWGAEDALPFPLCISGVGPPPECVLLENVSVARGNVILVDHGRRVRGETLGTGGGKSVLVPCAEATCGEAAIHTPERFGPQIEEAPLTFREPLPPPTSAAA